MAAEHLKSPEALRGAVGKLAEQVNAAKAGTGFNLRTLLERVDEVKVVAGYQEDPTVQARTDASLLNVGRAPFIQPLIERGAADTLQSYEEAGDRIGLVRAARSLRKLGAHQAPQVQAAIESYAQRYPEVTQDSDDAFDDLDRALLGDDVAPAQPAVAPVASAAPVAPAVSAPAEAAAPSSAVSDKLGRVPASAEPAQAPTTRGRQAEATPAVANAGAQPAAEAPAQAAEAAANKADAGVEPATRKEPGRLKRALGGLGRLGKLIIGESGPSQAEQQANAALEKFLAELPDNWEETILTDPVMRAEYNTRVAQLAVTRFERTPGAVVDMLAGIRDDRRRGALVETLDRMRSPSQRNALVQRLSEVLDPIQGDEVEEVARFDQMYREAHAALDSFIKGHRNREEQEEAQAELRAQYSRLKTDPAREKFVAEHAEWAEQEERLRALQTEYNQLEGDLLALQHLRNPDWAARDFGIVSAEMIPSVFQGILTEAFASLDQEDRQSLRDRLLADRPKAQHGAILSSYDRSAETVRQAAAAEVEAILSESPEYVESVAARDEFMSRHPNLEADIASGKIEVGSELYDEFMNHSASVAAATYRAYPEGLINGLANDDPDRRAERLDWYFRDVLENNEIAGLRDDLITVLPEEERQQVIDIAAAVLRARSPRSARAAAAPAQGAESASAASDASADAEAILVRDPGYREASDRLNQFVHEHPDYRGNAALLAEFRVLTAAEYVARYRVIPDNVIDQFVARTPEQRRSYMNWISQGGLTDDELIGLRDSLMERVPEDQRRDIETTVGGILTRRREAEAPLGAFIPIKVNAPAAPDTSAAAAPAARPARPRRSRTPTASESAAAAASEPAPAGAPAAATAAPADAEPPKARPKREVKPKTPVEVPPAEPAPAAAPAVPEAPAAEKPLTKAEQRRLAAQKLADSIDGES